MSQKSYKPKFKDKYFVNAISKFKIALSSVNTELESLEKVGGSK